MNKSTRSAPNEILHSSIYSSMSVIITVCHTTDILVKLDQQHCFLSICENEFSWNIILRETHTYLNQIFIRQSAALVVAIKISNSCVSRGKFAKLSGCFPILGFKYSVTGCYLRAVVPSDIATVIWHITMSDDSALWVMWCQMTMCFQMTSPCQDFLHCRRGGASFERPDPLTTFSSQWLIVFLCV